MTQMSDPLILLVLVIAAVAAAALVMLVVLLRRDGRAHADASREVAHVFYFFTDHYAPREGNGAPFGGGWKGANER